MKPERASAGTKTGTKTRKASGRAVAGTLAALVGAGALAVGVAGTAGANEIVSRAFPWSQEGTSSTVSMEDPWVFRGPTNYTVDASPACWMYPDHNDLVADISILASDRYMPMMPNWDILFFPVNDTATIDWHNTTTGARGQVVQHFQNSNGVIRVDGGDGVIEMDIHLRSDQPWFDAAGSTDLPFGHSEGSTHAVVDMTGKSCR